MSTMDVSLKREEKPKLRRRKMVLFKNNIDMYLMLLLPLVYLIIFKYIPIGGLVIAFQDYNIFDGILHSKWVGLENFINLISFDEFYRILRNTLEISVLKLVILFPMPILVAVMLNEMRCVPFKKTIQTVIYFPHFLSWVIISGIFINILSTSGGMVNTFLGQLGFDPIPFLYDNRYFRGVLVATQGWKQIGYDSIVYIAAIAGIEQELYEAAEIDGAGRIKRILHITIPGILPTVVMLLILNLGHILDAGTEQILAMYNPLVYESSDVIGTYVYRIGLGKMNYSFSTAVGLFNSVVGLILVICGNYLSRKWNERSIW